MTNESQVLPPPPAPPAPASAQPDGESTSCQDHQEHGVVCVSVKALSLIFILLLVFVVCCLNKNRNAAWIFYKRSCSSLMRKTLPNSIFLSVCLFDLGFHLNSRFALDWNLFVSNFPISPRVRHIEMCSTLKCGHFHNIVPSHFFPHTIFTERRNKLTDAIANQ